MLALLCSMPLISPNFDGKLIIFPSFGQGPFPQISGKSPDQGPCVVKSSTHHRATALLRPVLKFLHHNQQRLANHKGFFFSSFFHVQIQIGGTGVQTPPPPLENYKSIGFLSNTGPDPLNITKLPIHSQCWAIIGPPADGPLIVVFVSFPPSLIKLKKPLGSAVAQW